MPPQHAGLQPMGNHMMPHADVGGPHSHVAGPPPGMMMNEQPHPHYADGSMAPYAQTTPPLQPLQPLPSYDFPPSGNEPLNFNTEDAPMDEAMLGEPSRNTPPTRPLSMDPPEDEPPSLSKRQVSGSPDVANTFSTGDQHGTFASSEPPSGSNLAFSSDDNHGESYEDTEFYGSNSPTKSDNHEYFGHDSREGFFTSQSESALSPGEFNSRAAPGRAPFEFGQPAEPREPAPYQFHEPGESGDAFEHDPRAESQQESQYAPPQTETEEEVPLRPVESTEPLHQRESGRVETVESEHDESFEVDVEDFDTSKRHRSGLPPTSPHSQGGSEPISHTSSAMRGAQELLKRNRQKRLEMAARRGEGMHGPPPSNPLQAQTNRSDPISPPDKDVISPQSATTWESSSEVTSIVSGTSSAWTDGSANADRSSRRALILQMAKARMKKNNTSSAKHGAGGKGGIDPVKESEEEKKLDCAGEEEISIDVQMVRSNSLNTDIDIAGDLD